MKTGFVALFIAVLVGVSVSSPVLAHGRHHGGARVSIWYGPMWYGPAYYPVYAYPPVAYPQYYAPVIVPAAPTTYVEQPAPPANYWNFCRATNTYYPYVRECPGGWERVPTQPPSR
ncbi:TPA: hypothetical protein DIV48_02355 [Candidatus Kaiserbacteria bacterium]|nr:MAG: hypothetical protein UY93_C0001G0014 [Parcubacteria group bacterium GW2011_GWA1_56_13]KKW47005.1 MAG: hypothetical protein UY97_C0001G0062 [Parcubacteria group bacterium GW2011_GWB1_57_6]HCR52470.1 hypothetical protein [Candidatus Kaiserbacteria bacterium]